MKINIKNASKLFFQSPSLEMVYFEAIANSIDAGATSIDIRIEIDSYTRPETFSLSITDDGEGFNDKNFEKFSKLLQIEQKDHKGVGRLVFLRYFNNIEISSIYEGRQRKFVFNNEFDGEFNISDANRDIKQTVLIFKNYYKDKISTYDYIKPSSIKKALLQHFYPRFYKIKVNNEQLLINIELVVKEANPAYEFYSDVKKINVTDLPDLKKVPLPATGIDLFETLDLHYSINEKEFEKNIITAVCVDDRTIPIDIVAKGGIPSGYEIIFLLYSDLFAGKANLSRQELEMNDEELKVIKKIFSDKVAEILNSELPQITESNTKTLKILEDKFPHLSGYFDENPVGLIEKNQSLEIAQKKFFNAQKEILNATSLTDEQYEQSLEISSRVLTEYVLYRNLIISKIQKIDINSSEGDIHEIIVPRKKKYKNSNSNHDLFTNNAWLLDDKYMSYTTMLSDLEMTHLIKEISLPEEDVERDEKRPDIAIVFSNDPDTSEKVDVVIIELKKLHLPLFKREEVVSQLKQRARKLVNYYPNKIQRIWFYGIVDFDSDFTRSLKEENYAELFSKGAIYYKEHSVIPGDDDSVRIPVGLFVMSFEAFMKDAETRNSTFLNLLKNQIKQTANKNPPASLALQTQES